MTATEPLFLTIREAAEQVGRTPETVRRWVWSGRLAARKRGNRLIVTDVDLRRAAMTVNQPDLAAWVAALPLGRSRSSTRDGRSAADLVLEDRRLRARGETRHASR